MRPRRQDLFAIAAGVTWGLCWLPLGFAWALPTAFVLAIRGLRDARTPREAVRFGLVFGAARYAVASHFLLALLSWSPLGGVIYFMTIVYILPFAVVESLGAFWVEKRSGLPRAVGFGAIYMVLEKARTLGDLSFPADLLSHAFGTHPSWLAWVPWIGPFGLTALILATAALAEAAWEHRVDRRRALVLGAGALALWIAPPVSDVVLPSRAGSGADLRVAIVQPCVTVDDKLKREHWPAMRARLEDLTRRAAADVDLVVWPESARAGPLTWRDGEPLRDADVEALAREAGVPILYGCEIARVRDGKVLALYNGAALARPGGGDPQWYGKQHLLPFVEGIPYAKMLGLDPATRRRGTGRRGYLTLVGNFSAGESATVFRVGAARIGVMICYEGFYPDLGRTYRREGANVLAVLTNDAWWGRSIFPRWHAGVVATRAREIGVPVVRAANSGISSFVDTAGRTRASTPLFETMVVRVPVRPGSSEATLYTAAGDWPVWAGLLLLGGAIVRGDRRRA